MISGQIRLYEPPPPPPPPPPKQDNQHEDKIDNACALAMAKGMYIGKNVKKTWGFPDQVGTIQYFVRTERAYRAYSGKCEVLAVKWPQGHISHYHPDDLELVEKNDDTKDPEDYFQYI